MDQTAKTDLKLQKESLINCISIGQFLKVFENVETLKSDEGSFNHPNSTTVSKILLIKRWALKASL